MDKTLQAGAARRAINPPLGIGKIGGRLFGDPIQAIESDLTATALVLAGADTKVALVAAASATRSTAATPKNRVGHELGGEALKVAATYLPRAEDRPPGGWRLGERYALPDQIPLFYIALHPTPEQRALEGTLALIRQLTR